MDDFENAKSYFLSGLSFLEDANYERAEEALENSLRLLPNRVSTITNLAAVKIKLKKIAEARELATQSITLDPENYPGYLNLGLADKEDSQFSSAISCFDKAIYLNPEYVEAWFNKGAVLFEQGLFADALRNLEKAIQLNSEYAEAWSTKGAALNGLNQHSLALESIDHALAIRSDDAGIWHNKGAVLIHLKRYEEAISTFEKALLLEPDYKFLLGILIQTKKLICDWGNLSEYVNELSSKINLGEKVSHPFCLLSICPSEELQLQATKIWIKEKFPSNSSLGSIELRTKNPRIRLGYFSADFKNHAVATLTSELFELHDKDKFEVFAFSLSASDFSRARNRLESAFDHFINVENLSPISIAKRSRELKIDIAIDLGGFTDGSKTGIFSFRAAPIQISYLGYLGTMGAEYIDYLIADPTILPADSQKHYTEKIIYLPSYQVNDRKKDLGGYRFTRSDLGLPEQGFVFCSFNNSYKLSPDILDSWVRILNAVDKSILFLYADNEATKLNLWREASAKGLNPARVVFGGRISAPYYLARYQSCDLFLDTSPYNAGTTASDALYAGLPMLTQYGTTFAGRMGASILNALDLPELITYSSSEYESLAIELALNPTKLNQLKNKLVKNRSTTRLFDTPNFTKNLETAYQQIYALYLSGEPPKNIYTP